MSTLSRNIEMLRFDVSNRTFCVDVDQVLGIVSLPPNVHEAPPFVSFQEEMVSVHPLGDLLELEARAEACPQEVIIMRGSSGPYGISVDLVGEIYNVPVRRSLFCFPHASCSKIDMFGVWGVAMLDDELSLILEPNALVHDEASRASFSISQDFRHRAPEKRQAPSY